MALTGNRTFVGFGFGAIQAGLFLLEAFRSGAFRRLVVAEVVPETIAELREAGGTFSVNVAHPDRVESLALGPIEVEDPADPEGRRRLVSAVEEASEIATAVPSVRSYAGPGPGSIHRILAEGLTRRSRAGPGPALVYAAENHNRAAEILAGAVLPEVPVPERKAVERRARFLNTVIGKMSGVIADPLEVRARGLAPLTPRSPRAFLVEAFNRILISAIDFQAGDFPGGDLPAADRFRRGISVFEEKPDLLPFEEAKLYGHNATHAAAAYLAALRGLRLIADLRASPGAMAFLRAAFLLESGAALLEKHRGIDPLFTPRGFASYADDLLERMTNPHLGDTVERVGRDVRRKLQWEDRLIGVLRLALGQGIPPRRYAFAAAAALSQLDPALADPAVAAGPVLREIWGEAPPPSERAAVLEAVEEGRRRLARWMKGGFPDLERLMQEGPASSTM